VASAAPFHPGISALCASLRHKAQAATLAGDLALGIATYRELAREPTERAADLPAAGTIAVSSKHPRNPHAVKVSGRGLVDIEPF
jgi:hypothetical protein